MSQHVNQSRCSWRCNGYGLLCLLYMPLCRLGLCNQQTAAAALAQLAAVLGAVLPHGQQLPELVL